jgi:hypothetical protein
MEPRDMTIYYDRPYNKSNNHIWFLPDEILCVICGRSGTGKTSLMLDLLTRDGTLNYKDIYIYCPSKNQDAYRHLNKYCDNIDATLKNIGYDNQMCTFLNPEEDYIDPSQFDDSENHVMVFDDINFKKDQKMVCEFFTRGRNQNVDSFYLCQSYYKVPKHGIRDNANLYILFKHKPRDLRLFFSDHISGDMDYDEFSQFCEESWKRPRGYVVIDLSKQPDSGRYWDNYIEIYIPKSI